MREVISECKLHVNTVASIISLKLSPPLVLLMACRNCSANCPSQAPPMAPSIGRAGCSGNPASPTALSNVTGCWCCPGNAHPPIASWFRGCCCSGGGSKPAVPSVEKLEKVKNYLSPGKVAGHCFLLVPQQRGGDEEQRRYLCRGQCSVPSDTPGGYHGWQRNLLADIDQLREIQRRGSKFHAFR